jgi:hypothetical protein
MYNNQAQNQWLILDLHKSKFIVWIDSTHGTRLRQPITNKYIINWK